MPISVVVGGQYGSEGKGKVAALIARNSDDPVVVRVGGTNSGHTAIDGEGRKWAFRQLPAASIHGAEVVLPAGSFVDPEIFHREVAQLGIAPSRLHLSPYAMVVEEKDKEQERSIVSSIGSTGSGIGAALGRRVSRSADILHAAKCPSLAPYVRDVEPIFSRALAAGRRIVIEGSQGFGLSLFHGGVYPHATSRDTTAGTFLGEAGLSPLDVDDITLVIRTYPIRVGGNSGDLDGETDWPTVARRAGLAADYVEKTTATGKVRRVAAFRPDIVRRALAANRPTRLVLNHCDYLDPAVRDSRFTEAALAFVESLEADVSRRVDWLGIGPGPGDFLARDSLGAARRVA